MTDDNEAGDEAGIEAEAGTGSGAGVEGARVRSFADRTWVRLPPMYEVSAYRLTAAEWALMHPKYEDGELVSILLGYRTGGVECLCIEEVVSVPNTAKDPTTSFKVSKSALTDSQRRRVLGVMHSHDTGLTLPSTADLWSIPAGWLGGVVVDGEIVGWYVRQMQVPTHRVKVIEPKALR